MAEAGEQSRVEQLRKQVAKSRALKQQGITYEVIKDPARNQGQVGSRIVAKIGDQVAGYLHLKPYDEINKGREIRQITTNPGFERKGIASSLFNEARKLGLKPLHSEVLSQQGREFRQAVGGRGVRPEIGPRQKEDAMTQKEIRENVRSAGRERAIAVARLRANPNAGIDVSTPEARRNLNIFRPENRTAAGLPPLQDTFDSSPRTRTSFTGNPAMGISPVGAFGNVLAAADLLRMLNMGGRAAQGRLNLLPGDPTIGQMR